CERLKRPRKSSWWAEAFRGAGQPPSECRWIYIADRESDFYEPIHICQQTGMDFVIRGCQDRRLADEAGKLRESLAKAALLGQSTVELRSRGGEPARTAIVELRSVQSRFGRPVACRRLAGAPQRSMGAGGAGSAAAGRRQGDAGEGCACVAAFPELSAAAARWG